MSYFLKANMKEKKINSSTWGRDIACFDTIQRLLRVKSIMIMGPDVLQDSRCSLNQYYFHLE